MEDIAKLAKSLEEAKELVGSIGSLKQEKLKLERNTSTLKRVNEEEQTQHKINKQEREKEIDTLNEAISRLKAKRANLAISTVPEIKKLNALKKEVDEKQAKLDRNQVSVDAKSDRVAKDQVKVENKRMEKDLSSK